MRTIVDRSGRREVSIQRLSAVYTLRDVPLLTLRLTEIEMAALKVSAGVAKVSVAVLVRRALWGPQGKPGVIGADALKTDRGAPLAGPVRPTERALPRRSREKTEKPSKPAAPSVPPQSRAPKVVDGKVRFSHDEPTFRRTVDAGRAAREAQERRDDILRKMRGGKGSGG